MKEKVGIEMKEKVGIGIIGTGFARRVQIPSFLECENARVVSVASGRPENARATAEEFGIGHFTGDWRETVALDEVDLVCITTPPDTHYEMTLAALEAGKHVLCEKPMAMSVAEAREMTEKAREKGVLALIDHELRFQDGRRKALEMLRAGAIGRIRHVKYHFRNASRADKDLPWSWWSSREHGGGALGAIGSHIIDSFNFFLGAQIREVFCQLQSHIKERRDEQTGEMRPVTSDDEAQLVLRFADGPLTEDATGIVSISVVEYPDYQNVLEFFGSEGALRIGYLGEIEIAEKGRENWRRIETEKARSPEGIFDSGFPSAFMSFAPHIVEAVRAGRTEIEHAAHFEDGLKVQKILDAAHESNEKKCVIEIGEN
jgi:predicted dehydrogenase